MRIQHNVMAMNAYRNYNTNTSALAKNLEKLSSGYKINRAGDDAAGLAISEKMRAQITGLNAASKNVKDGISLVKTAEGAMQEIQDMLNRMKYLATQSANGTYENTVDRKNLQKEVAALKDEINRIADSANFNGIKLLDGSLEAKETEISSGVAADPTAVQDMIAKAESADVTVTKSAAKGPSFTSGELTDLDDTKYDAFKITYTNADGEEKSVTLIEDKVAGVSKTASKAGTDLANALANGSLKLATTGDNAKDDLEELLNLFNVKADSNEKKISFSAKDPNSSVKVTKIEQGVGADPNAAIAALADKGGSSVKAAGTQAKVVLGTATAGTATSITVGDKTYETSDKLTAAASNEKARAEDLMKQLKADGYEVELDSSDATGKTFIIKNLDEAQKGAQISNLNDDKWKVEADAGTKGKATFTISAKATDNSHAPGAGGGGTAAGDAAVKNTRYNYTLTYVNEAGETVKKTLTIEDSTATPTATTLGDLVKASINNDSELSEMFKATNTAGEITIESKGSGTGSAYIVGLSSDDLQVDEADAYVKAPKDTGKILSMAETVDSDPAAPTYEKIKSGDQITVNGKTYEFVKDPGKTVADGVTKVLIDDDATHGAEDTWKNLQKALAKDGVESELYRADGSTTVTGLRFTDTASKTETVKSGGLTLQIADTADSFNQLRVNVGDMHTNAMGKGKTTLDGKEIEVTKTIADIDISKLEGAQEATGVITNAINYVSEIRGDLGAVQNRLEHTANNLSVMTENIQDAESTIRDTDVAEEMMAYTKNNILIQSAQAMLAQANAVPQGVLQLLG